MPRWHAAAVRPASRPAAASIAVLDLRNLSPDTSDTYLAEGMAVELTSRLLQLGRLVVKARTAVEMLRRAGQMSAAELGRALNVSCHRRAARPH